MSLNNQSVQLSGLGRQEQALAAIEEAVTIRRTLAEARPAAVLPNLATSLNNLADVLSEMGRKAESEAAKREAAALRQSL
jgi:tetratricopeptide (TPR) repeat protein